MAMQTMPDRHSRQHDRKFPAVKGNRLISGALTRKSVLSGALNRPGFVGGHLI
jgi:hypothetical protein